MRTTQREKILRYLLAYGTITPLDALREFSCMRLGARIWELKDEGWPITATLAAGKNKFGDTTHWAVYTLDRGGRTDAGETGCEGMAELKRKAAEEKKRTEV